MRLLKVFTGFLGLLLVLGTLFSPAKADTFYGTLVPMSTAVTLSSSVTELVIGTKTTLTYGGGDGTGGYRFNNAASTFCSVDINGVVSANYPGQCSFTVTRLASGKYIDTTSQSVSIMALPEPDKSFISTPEPDPTPTPRASRSATPTPSANPTSSPAPARIEVGSSTPRKSDLPLVKKVTGVRAQLSESAAGSGFKFSWKNDSQAVSYSVTVVTEGRRINLESRDSSVNVPSLSPGSYTIEVRGIDSNGKISTPAVSKFVIPAPRAVTLTSVIGLTKPQITLSLKRSLDSFISQATLGYPVEVSIEYPKSVQKSLAQAKVVSALITKYLKDKKPGTVVTVSLKAQPGNVDFLTVRGKGQKQRPTLQISRG